MGKRADTDVLHGHTYAVEIEDGQYFYVTINNVNHDPSEVFIRFDVPEYYEWVTVLTVLITRLLEEQVPLSRIADDLREVQSPRTRHFIPGGGGEACSICDRIGRVFEKHLEANPK